MIHDIWYMKYGTCKMIKYDIIYEAYSMKLTTEYVELKSYG